MPGDPRSPLGAGRAVGEALQGPGLGTQAMRKSACSKKISFDQNQSLDTAFLGMQEGRTEAERNQFFSLSGTSSA